MNAPLPNTVVSDLIGAIHECAIDPARWTDTLSRLRELLNFRMARIDDSDPAAGEMRISAASGIAPECVKRIEECHASDVVEVWRGKEFDLGNFWQEDAYVLSRRNPDALSRTSDRRFEWRRLLGIGDAVAIPLTYDGRRIGAVGLTKAHGDGLVTQAEVDAVRLFVPHLQRAAAIRRQLDSETSAVAAFAAMLDGLSSAVILVDPDLRVVHANGAAQAMFSAADTLRCHGGTLSLSAPGATALLAAAVADTGIGREGARVPVRGRHGKAHLLHVLPLRHDLPRPSLPPRAAAAVFVAQLGPRPCGCLDAIQVLFGLTAAETAVLEQIAAGRDLARTASALDIGVNTAKTHLQRLFNKTGAHRQADLVALVSSLALPLRG